MAPRKTIKVMTFVRFQAVLMAFVGLVAGVVYSFGGAIADMTSAGGMNGGTALAFMALVGMPIVFGVGGAVLGLVEAAIFNLLGGWLGWVDLDFGR